MRDYKNILCIRSDRLGEFLLTLPAIKLMKINHPKSKIFLLAQKNNIELIKGIDFIDGFFEYKPDYTIWELIKILKGREYDCVVVFNPYKKFHFLSFILNIPDRVGYNRKWGWCLNKKIKDDKYLAEKHEVEYNIDLVRLICKEVLLPHYDFPVDDKNTIFFLKEKILFNKKYIVIHPFSSHHSKNMDIDFWYKLLNIITSKYEVLLIGGDYDRGNSTKYLINNRIINLVGILSLRNLACLLKNFVFCFIGVDSGPMHLASILNLPTVGIFKASNPIRWAPLSKERLILDISKDKDILDRIINFIEVYGRQSTYN